MKRELLAITADLVRQQTAAAGCVRVEQWHDEECGLVAKWRRSDGTEIVDNDPEVFSEPLRQAFRARLLSGLLLECPRCGARAADCDPDGFTEQELDRAQVLRGVTTQLLLKLTPADGDVTVAEFGAGVEQVGGVHFVVLLHHSGCEVAPVNLRKLGEARWN